MVPAVYAEAAALQAARRNGERPGRLNELWTDGARRRATAVEFSSAAARRGGRRAGPAARSAARLGRGHDLGLDDEHRARRRASGARRVAVHSPDGVTPPPELRPAAHCKRAADVCRPTLDPVFVAGGEELEHDARGALVGIKLFQLRQLYALLERAPARRRRAGRAQRGRRAAARLGPRRHPRKGRVGALGQVDRADAVRGGRAAYGSRDAKLGAAWQRAAWDANAAARAADRLAAAAAARRARGEFGDASFLRTRMQAMLDMAARPRRRGGGDAADARSGGVAAERRDGQRTEQLNRTHAFESYVVARDAPRSARRKA